MTEPAFIAAVAVGLLVGLPFLLMQCAKLISYGVARGKHLATLDNLKEKNCGTTIREGMESDAERRI